MLFGSTLLEVAIGVIFVYLLLSMLCSALSELCAILLSRRARNLKNGIAILLGDPQLVADFFNHPLIKALGQRPSYIPARTFSLALWNLATKAAATQAQENAQILRAAAKPGDNAAAVAAEQAEAKAAAVAETGVTRDLALIKSLVKSLPEWEHGELNTSAAVTPKPTIRRLIDWLLWDYSTGAASGKRNYKDIKTSLETLFDEAGGDIDKARANIEEWYNDAMDRVSGVFRRYTHGLLLVTGLLAAAALNVDTINVVKALWYNDTLRASVATAAETYIKTQPTPTTSPTPLVALPPGNTAVLSNPQSISATPVGSPSPTSTSPSDETETPLQKIRAIRGEINTLGLPLGWGERKPVAPQMKEEKYQKITDSKARQAAFAVDLEQYKKQLAIYDADLSHFPRGGYDWLLKILGLCFTALAVSQGAPFWFDLLNKIIVIRSTVKPHEKSPEQPSKDKPRSESTQEQQSEERNKEEGKG